MPTIPPSLTPAPTPAPQRNDRATFSARVDAFVTWLIAFVAQMTALATNCYNNAVDSLNSATSATTSAGTAATQAGIATAQAAAALAAAQSALSAASTGTSTTSITIGSGAQTFTVQNGKSWVAGMALEVFSSAGNKMNGTVTSYSGTTLMLNIVTVTGSGTYANWTIYPEPGVISINGTTGAYSSVNDPVALFMLHNQ